MVKKIKTIKLHTEISMASTSFEEIKRKANALAERVSEATGVKKSIALNILMYAKCLCHPSRPDVIDKLVFFSQMGHRFGVSSGYHIQLMFEALREPRADYIPIENYVRAIATFLSKDLNAKILLVFQVYNFNKTGFIKIRDMQLLLKNSIVGTGEDDANEQLKELIEMIVHIVDRNEDRVISLEEFSEFVKRDILCLELFGKVLPQKKDIDSFRQTMEHLPPEKVRDYYRNERGKCLSEPNPNAKENPLYPGVQLEML